MGGIFESNDISGKLQDIEKKILDQNIWKDNLKAKKILKKKNFEDIISSFEKSNHELKNLKDLNDLAQEEKNEEILQDCILKIEELSEKVKKMK